jgi:DNA-binding Lrp family transcriptional regulator
MAHREAGAAFNREREEEPMVTAILLMNVERGRINSVAEDLAGRSGVSEVYSVSGNYDLVAMLRVATNDEMARLVTEELAAVDGIEHTETMLAFRAHSRHDLEAMFSVGG